MKKPYHLALSGKSFSWFLSAPIAYGRFTAAIRGISFRSLVENDQTSHGGNIASLHAFFDNAYEVPVSMTFDIGNWLYVDEQPQEAIKMLRSFVGYIHIKHVIKSSGKLVTTAISNNSNEMWKDILKGFSDSIFKALEFPMDERNKSRAHFIAASSRTGGSSMNSLDVITFGEAMSMFMAEQPGPLHEIKHYTKELAGAETNVAIGLARLGLFAQAG